MKAKVKSELILDRLNNPQWMPGEGFSDPLRGNYKTIMECEYSEHLYGKIICPEYHLIGEDGVRSATFAGSVFEQYFEII